MDSQLTLLADRPVQGAAEDEPRSMRARHKRVGRDLRHREKSVVCGTARRPDRWLAGRLDALDAGGSQHGRATVRTAGGRQTTGEHGHYGHGRNALITTYTPSFPPSSPLHLPIGYAFRSCCPARAHL